MDEDEPESVAERMFTALVSQLIRSGKIDRGDVFDAADRLDADGDDEAAHVLRCIPITAEAPSASDFHAEQRRQQIRLVPDGGNTPT